MTQLLLSIKCPVGVSSEVPWVVVSGDVIFILVRVVSLRITSDALHEDECLLWDILIGILLGVPWGDPRGVA